MSKEIMYKQCKLEKKLLNGGRMEKVTWLPEKFAIEGEFVRLKEPDDSWSDNWKVLSASGEALTEKYVVHQSHAHTRQRKASDI